MRPPPPPAQRRRGVLLVPPPPWVADHCLRWNSTRCSCHLRRLCWRNC